MSKLISRLLWFRISTLCDWLKHLAPPLNQSDVKPKPIATSSLARSLACLLACLLACTRFPALSAGYVYLVASRSYWFIGLSASVMIGQSHYFGFENCSKQTVFCGG